MSKYIQILFLCFFLISCKKELNENGVWYFYAETGCADKWIKYPHKTDNELANSVTRYLEEQNIKVFEVKITRDEELKVVCLACNCITGRYINVLSNSENELSLTQIGFTKGK